MENYHKKDLKTKIIDLNNGKRKVMNAYEQTTILAQKTSSCYNKIEELVKKEVEKGMSLEEAIKKVLYDSNSIERLYPQLKEEMVKKKIASLIRGAEYNKNRKKKSKKIDDGEIEL